MIEWRFYIDDIEFDQPESFTDLILGLKRDDQYHGVFFEASVGSLSLSGLAGAYLMEKDDALGLQAVVTFRADIRCDEEEEFSTLISGKFDMAKLERQCGANCKVNIPIEQSNCTMLFRNRFDQKVDMDSLVAFDKVTVLEDYAAAGITVNMPSKAIQVGAKGFVDVANDFILYSDNIIEPSLQVYVRPSYLNSVDESIVTTQLEPSVYIGTSDSNFGQALVSPVVLLEENIDCFDGNFIYRFRFKGHLSINNPTATAWIRVVKGTILEGESNPLGYLPGSPTNGLTELGVYEFSDMVLLDPYDAEFDQTIEGTTTLEMGQGIWAYVYTSQFQLGANDNSVLFDPETEVFIEAERQCPETDAKIYLVHEALSRVVEAVSEGCLKVRSEYYGRTDSQPYASLIDGCGGLRAFDSGLQLRNAVDAKMFASPKDLFDGLNAIDNIGFGIEPNPDLPGFDQLRVEEVKYFYREEQILELPMAPNGVVKNIIEDFYSRIRVGYEKWEVEQVKGLDEIHSNREYRTSLNNVRNELNIMSKLIAGSYAAEITRQQSFAATGGADTTYDNEIFIFCLVRNAYEFDIEQGGMSSPTDLYSPTTIYNWRIRPYYNLMRWFKTIAAGYAHVGDTEKKLFFTSGTGNFRAAGELTDTNCKLENGVKAENSDLGKNDFVGPEYQPLWRPKTVSFKYPISVAQYKALKLNPYGYVSVQCGTFEWIKGYIDTVQYSPDKGEADFNLKIKWQQ